MHCPCASVGLFCVRKAMLGSPLRKNIFLCLSSLGYSEFKCNKDETFSEYPVAEVMR